VVTNSNWLDKSASRLTADIEQLREAVAAAAVTMESPGGEVAVTVGAGGAVTNLHLSALAMRLDRIALGSLIVSTVARATERVGEELVELTAGRGFTGAAHRAIPPAPAWGSIPPIAPRLPDPPESAATPPSGPEAAEVEERLRGLLDESRARLDRYAELERELAAATTTVRSDDRLVAVTVRAGGALVAVDIAPGAEEEGPQRMAGAVLAALSYARSRASLAMADRVAEVVAGRIDVRAMVESAIDPTLLARIRGDQDQEEGR
jgi:DNA-binding protein YbaB